MAKVAYRFLPCADDGRPLENSRYTRITDDSEAVAVGTVLEAELLGRTRWQVVELHEERGSLLAVHDQEGSEIPCRGALVCRPLG